MVIFNHGVATKDKGEEVRGGAIHQGISHGRRSFTTKRVYWIRSLERKLQWRKRMRERERKGMGMKERQREKLNFEVCLTRLSFIKVTKSVTHASIYSLSSFLEKLPWEASVTPLQQLSSPPWEHTPLQQLSSPPKIHENTKKSLRQRQLKMP